MKLYRNDVYLFTQAELESITIEPRPRAELADAYLVEREAVWLDELTNAGTHGDSMWNGEIYTLEEIVTSTSGQVTLGMSTCEFKDVVLRMVRGKESILERYGAGYSLNTSGVTMIPVTRDGQFVFGARGDYAGRGTHPMGLIGGTLNKDEMEIHDFAGIQRFMLKEAAEETRFKFDIADLRFVALGHAPHAFLFLFTGCIGLTSEEVTNYHRGGEFSHLRAMSVQEAAAYTLPATPGFSFWRQHLDLVFDSVNSLNGF